MIWAHVAMRLDSWEPGALNTLAGMKSSSSTQIRRNLGFWSGVSNAMIYRIGRLPWHAMLMATLLWENGDGIVHRAQLAMQGRTDTAVVVIMRYSQLHGTPGNTRIIWCGSSTLRAWWTSDGKVHIRCKSHYG